MTKKKTRAVNISLSDQRWRGLELQARLMSEVFGQRIRAEDIVRATVEKALESRAPRGSR